MNGEFEMTWKGDIVVCFNVVSPVIVWIDRETPRKLGTSGLLAKI
jgi:hypothetical protein